MFRLIEILRLNFFVFPNCYQFLKSSKESDDLVDSDGPENRGNTVATAPIIFNSLNDSSYQMPRTNINESEKLPEKLPQNYPAMASSERADLFSLLS